MSIELRTNDSQERIRDEAVLRRADVVDRVEGYFERARFGLRRTERVPGSQDGHTSENPSGEKGGDPSSGMWSDRALKFFPKRRCIGPALFRLLSDRALQHGREIVRNLTPIDLLPLLVEPAS